MEKGMIDRAPSGHRCGQSHPRARLTDDQVREMRQLHQQRGKGYFLLGIIFGCSEWTARDICTYRTRWNA